MERSEGNGVGMRGIWVRMRGIRVGMRGIGGGNAGNRGGNIGNRTEIEKKKLNFTESRFSAEIEKNEIRIVI